MIRAALTYTAAALVVVVYLLAALILAKLILNLLA